jgi:hypothetical protein
MLPVLFQLSQNLCLDGLQAGSQLLLQLLFLLLEQIIP